MMKDELVGAVIVHNDGAAYVILGGVVGHHVTAVLANMSDQPAWGSPVVALPWPLDGAAAPRAAKLPVVVTACMGGADKRTGVEVHNATDEQITYGMQQLDPTGGWTLARIKTNRAAWPGQPWFIPDDWRPGASREVTVEYVRKLMKDAP